MSDDWQADNDETIIAWLRDWNATAVWNSRVLGPRPESAECRIPLRLFKAAGVRQPGRREAAQKQPKPPESAGREHVVNADNVEDVAARMERRATNMAGEAQRVALARLEQAKATRGRYQQDVLHEGGRSRLVHRIATTAEKLVGTGKLNRGQKGSLERFAMLVADALGAATLDADGSTSRLTAQYEPGGTGYGPKTVSDRCMAAVAALDSILKFVPPEYIKTFVEIAADEVGVLMGKPRSLAAIGEARGYTDKRASAAGSVEVCMVIELIAHLMKMADGAIRENRPMPDCDTMSRNGPRMLSHSDILDSIAG